MAGVRLIGSSYVYGFRSGAEIVNNPPKVPAPFFGVRQGAAKRDSGAFS